MRRWMIPLFALLTACDARLESLAQTVHVFVPEAVETSGPRVPVLYLEKDRALFLPHGAGGGRPVELRPSELAALRERSDIVIIAVDSEPSPHAERLPDGRTRYVTHLGGS
ncbi:lipoprotein [Myxococcus stipitatus DSM 14675]|uniref:Lipoprotein n=1 Tax=Myxococcus stipitatus (strain DSM 14675 / JCM 12634 / Mx s8) TaxID=1278073 RepID=L7U403_MYXSD|nr:hypothetical protein [Myxococcus stipitatus]AGC42585.1 lipoprotein [Myxococcus stipitatus DSM 14675]